METLGVAVAEAYFKHVLFFNNTSGNLGGGMTVVGVEASVSFVADVVFDSNVARSGGAVSFGNTRLFNITGATFRNNR